MIHSAKTPQEVQQIEDWIREEELAANTDGSSDFVDEESEIEKAIAHGNDALERQNARTATSQEIGPLPPVKNPQRRAACKFDLRKTCLTYFANACSKGLSPYQEEMIRAFQEVILSGGKKTRAVRRGGLKSTIARIAAIWGTSNGHIKFPVLVGATDDKSNEHRDNFLDTIATSPKLLEDFPELIPLILKLKNPKKQLRLDGELLKVTAKDERGCIVFPTIEGVECSGARVAAYSILATDVSGLSFIEDGRPIRPDAIFYDDVQTPQSAKSPSMTSQRENAIVTTFEGLKGLGETLAQVMVCTVREEDDLTNRFLSRERHPDWDGRKFPVLLKEPTDKEHWVIYCEKLREGATPKDGLALATAYYLEHRDVMDAGHEVAWETDKEEEYVSALQYCMTIRSLNPAFFRTELQQEGAALPTGLVQLGSDVIVKRVSGVPRGVVPHGATYLTAFVDSSDKVLWWMVVAWKKDFSGWIVDFGTWPDQKRSYFTKADLAMTIEQAKPGVSWEEAFVHAHNEVDKRLLQAWPSEGGTSREIDLLLKDWSDGGQHPRIEAQVMASKNKNRIRPSKGFAPKPGKKPVHLYGNPREDRNTGNHWVERRSENPVHVQFDSNVFKSHGCRRLQTVVGAPSCVLLPGDDVTAFDMLADHFTAEHQKSLVYDETPGIVWEEIPGRDNDWWDCYVGNNVAASVLGCSLPGEVQPAGNGRKRYSAQELLELQRTKGKA